MIRKTIFWLHLGVGVCTGLVIAMMSLTGVLLTYEVQMIELADRSFYVAAPAGVRRQSLDEILEAADAAGIDARRVTVAADRSAPVLANAGRGESAYVNPYTGDVLGAPSPFIRKVFSKLTAIHRWFGADREHRRVPRLVTGLSNLAFLFLIISGLYLWLPRVLRWPLVRARLIMTGNRQSSRASDFNWHHVFGIWSALPLLVVVATAVVFSFSWANALVYKAAGEDPPARRQSANVPEIADESLAGEGAVLALEDLLEVAAAVNPSWRRIILELPEEAAASVEFTVDSGNGRQPQYREKLHIRRSDGEILRRETFSDRSVGTQARYLIRFLHTGEALGMVGQTVAGIVSFTSLIMVWTGFALAYRRLVRPLLRRRIAAAQST